ncbi:putative RDD family membrane protein YckC [Hamadaea flava]|uniref:RDD family protein n=1 Tax=Hamadaea flava TaxID=1742688 RepID=A0ABV8M0D2_9ACTN|nr:RDD family protein [Hamadaea flava]MCP2325808.1 putative RDD family membrane protein YckC [Hamadaea flava]
MSVAPGWYPDPADPDTTRYWDGEGWADQQTEDPSTPAGTAQPVETAVAPPPVTFPGQQPPGNPPPGPYAPVKPPWWPEDIAFPPTGPVTPHGLALASPGRRLAARAIDLGALLVLNLIFNGYFLFQWIMESATLGQEWLRSGELDPQSWSKVGELGLIISLIAYALWFAYEVPVTHSRGQTLGKMALGLRVIPWESTERLPFGRSFRRWSLFGYPFLLYVCCGVFGFVLPIIDNFFVATDSVLRLAWHDRLARTFVVRIPDRKAPLN